MTYCKDFSSLPMNNEIFVQFNSQSKNQTYSLFDAALYRDEGDPLRFSYTADHPLTVEFEEQMTELLRDYSGHGEFLIPHAPEEPGMHDDTCSMAVLGCFGAARGQWERF